MFEMMSGSVRQWGVTVAVALVALAVPARQARAHCDSMDGPVVTAARKALETGNVSTALIWVRAADEAEVRKAFERTRSVRRLNPDARELADVWFFETVVRLHRQGEGEPYTGLKPAGAGHTEAIEAADRALSSGSVAALDQMLTNAVRGELHERFTRALALSRNATADVEAGRAFVAAYVAYLHYAEEVHALAAGRHEERSAQAP